jgi:hypothetical protein
MNEKEFYRDNMSLKRVGVVYEFEQWQKDEIEKCTEDPIYFIRNYVKIISLDEGIIFFDMHDYQEEMIRAFHENRFSIVKIGRQSGKCAAYKSLISVKNKKTGEIKQLEIGRFFDEIKSSANTKI